MPYSNKGSFRCEALGMFITNVQVRSSWFKQWVKCKSIHVFETFHILHLFQINFWAQLWKAKVIVSFVDLVLYILSVADDSEEEEDDDEEEEEEDEDETSKVSKDLQAASLTNWRRLCHRVNVTLAGLGINK